MEHDATKIGLLRSRCRLLCIMFLAVIVCAGCGGSHVHQTQGRELVDSIDNLLVSEKLCKDRNDCTRKEYVFMRPSTVIEIYVYGVMDRSIAKKIVGLCIDAHEKNPEIEYKLNMYALTKREDLKSFKHKTAMLELILRKEE